MNAIEQRYLKAIRSRVCFHCKDLMPDKVCGLADRICPIEQNLQEVVLMVHYVHGQSIQPYLDDLRHVVCTVCGSENMMGRCRLRETLDCALNRYFYLVVEAIDSVQDEIRVEVLHAAGSGGGAHPAAGPNRANSQSRISN